MKHIQEWLDEYGQSHQNRINKRIHWVCVPLIMISLVGLLSIVRFSEYLFLIGLGNSYDIDSLWMLFFYFDLSTILILIAFLYYLRMSIPMASGMLVIGILARLICDLLVFVFPVNYRLVFSMIFVAGWIGQFIGHKIEGKKPSFIKDVQFLLIGPAWLLSFIFNKFGIRY
mgnify:CR=1 FL=1